VKQCSVHHLDKPSSNDRLTKKSPKDIEFKKLHFVDKQCSACKKTEHINDRNVQSP